MSSVQKIFIASVTFLFLSACGLKGDLYLPEAEPQVVDTPVEETEAGEESLSSDTIETTPEPTKEDSPTP